MDQSVVKMHENEAKGVSEQSQVVERCVKRSIGMQADMVPLKGARFAVATKAAAAVVVAIPVAAVVAVVDEALEQVWVQLEQAVHSAQIAPAAGGDAVEQQQYSLIFHGTTAYVSKRRVLSVTHQSQLLEIDFQIAI